MKIKAILAALLISATFISCDDEGDVTKPVINLIAPAEGEVVTVGDLHFEVEFSDDVALASYKVNIHPAAGHTHSSLSRDGESEWEYTKTWDDIDGLRNADIHHHDIIIDTPTEHCGEEYHFMVYCTDQAGNQSNVVRTITINE